MGKSRDPLANSSIYLERNKEPEQKLWISVLSKAVDDAFQVNDFGEALKSINWIKRAVYCFTDGLNRISIWFYYVYYSCYLFSSTS